MTYYLNTDQKNFHQQDYAKAVEIITPKTYIVEDTNAFGYQTDLFDQLINTQLDIANNISSIININGINNLSSISKYFIKQNELTYLNLQKFQDYILTPLEVSLNDFKSKDEYYAYIRDVVLPKTRLNYPDPLFTSGNTTSASHTYLTNALGWFYFLNTTNPYTTVSAAQPYNILLDLLGTQLFEKKQLTLADGMAGLHEYLWRTPQLSSTYILSNYRSPASPDKYTSGTQQLDKLKTLLSVLYSPLYTNETDVSVKEAFDDFINGGIKLISRESAGPFWKLLKAFSFSVFDKMDEAQELETLTDIKKCPPEYLPYLADLIGWTLFGSDPEKWRLQLLNAVEIYKSVGTKKSLDLALKSVLIGGDFNIENEISELWESYVPHLIYYALATESNKLVSLETWTPSIAKNLGVLGYSNSSIDENVRLAADRIILETVEKFPNEFKIGGTTFPVGSPDFTFYYRNRVYPIPPWEEYPYYINTDLNDEMIDFIVDKLACFGVRKQFALQVGEYLKTNVMRADDDIRFNNKWLIFTETYNEPPNLQNLLNDISNKKIEYLPLWSGKSSHFTLTLNAQNFNFVKNRLDKNSDRLIDILGQIIGSFSPTHSIPNVNLTLSGEDFNRTIGEVADLNVKVSKTSEGILNIETSGGIPEGMYGLGYGMALDHGDYSLFRLMMCSGRARQYISNSEWNTIRANPFTQLVNSYPVIFDFFPDGLNTQLAGTKEIPSEIMDLDAAFAFFRIPEDAQYSYTNMPNPFKGYLDKFVEGFIRGITENKDRISAMSPLGQYLKQFGILDSFTPKPEDFISSDIYFHILTVGSKITNKILSYVTDYPKEPPQNLFAPQEFNVNEALNISSIDPDELDPSNSLSQLDPETRRFYLNHSNQFAVAGNKTATGKPIHNIDPHLGAGLTSRALWFIPFRMKCSNFKFFGGLTPGTCMIPFGATNELSWSFTANAPEYLIMYALSAINPSYNYQNSNFSGINRIYESGFKYKSYLTEDFVEPQKTQFTYVSKDGFSKTYKFLDTTHGRICYYTGEGTLKGQLDNTGDEYQSSGIAFAITHNLRRINPTYQFLGMMTSKTIEQYNSYYENQYQIQYNNIVTTNEGTSGAMQYTCGARYRKMVTNLINCFPVLEALNASSDWIRSEYTPLPSNDLNLTLWNLTELPRVTNPNSGYLVCNNVPPSIVTESTDIPFDISSFPRSMVIASGSNDVLVTNPLKRHKNCFDLLKAATQTGNVTPQTLSSIQLNVSSTYEEFIKDISSIFVASAATYYGANTTARNYASAVVSSWGNRNYFGHPSSTYVTEVAFFDWFRSAFPPSGGGRNEGILYALSGVRRGITNYPYSIAGLTLPVNVSGYEALVGAWETVTLSSVSYIFPYSVSAVPRFYASNDKLFSYKNRTGGGGGSINAMDIAYSPPNYGINPLTFALDYSIDPTRPVFYTPGGVILNSIVSHRSTGQENNFEIYFRSINPPTRIHSKPYNDVLPSAISEGKFLKITFNDQPAYDQLDVNVNIYVDNSLNIIDIQTQDAEELLASGNSLARHEVSGVALNAYSRTYNPTGTVYKRADLDNYTDAGFQASSVQNKARKAFRRRGYEKIMPKNGYYDRTGFNMPITWDVSSRDESKFIPLGLIPSALIYQTITDYENIPDVYGFCENYGSDNIYYGFAVSNTYPCRGYKPIRNGIDYYVDRCQIPDIYAVMAYIKEGIKIQNASALVYSNLSAYQSDMKWKDVIQSIANETPDPVGYDSSSASLYYDFKFGREFHKWYNIYKDEFSRHHTGAVLLDLDGPNILAHTLGSIFRNSKLNLPGANASAITIDLNDIKYIRNDANFANGSYVASSTSSIYVSNPEIRNATILSGVELVHTSAVSNDNLFIVYNLDRDNKRKNEPDYLYDAAYIQLRSLEGLPRVRFDLRAYSNPSVEHHPIQTNFLLPNHKYRLDLNALASNDSGSILGDCTLGVWIHTSSEGGYVWTYNNEGAWIKHSNNVSYENLFNQYTHILKFSRKDLRDVRARRYNCIDEDTQDPQSNVLASFTDKDFQSFTLDFHTLNYQLSNYNDKYERTLFGAPHRKDQNYIIEIFMMPSQNNTDKFVLLSGINVLNKTLKQYSEVFATADKIGIPLESVYCNDFRVKLSKEQLLSVARFYNTIAGYYASEMPYASRDASKTASFLGVSGGSRVNYVISPDWAVASRDTSSSLLTNLIVDI